MKTIYKFIAVTVLGMWSLNAAAESTPVTARFNCVLEKNGTLGCHEKRPCVAFFDVVGESAHSINGVLMQRMKALNLIDAGVNVVELELFGIISGASIHEDWSMITKEQIDGFWCSVSAVDVEGAAARDLNQLSLGVAKLANYIIKVSYHSSK